MMYRLMSMLAVVAIAGSANAAIFGFEAESGTLSPDYSSIADPTALGGGSYIEHATDNFANGASQPNTDAFTSSYELNLPAGTYDVYVRMRFADNGEDSFFVAKSFGDKDPTVTADWLKVEGTTAGLGSSQTTFAWSDALVVTTLTSTGGAVTWEIGAREAGLDIDAFALVSTGQSVTDTDLDNAVLVPEPASLALVGLGSLMFLGRRRQA
jgi:hypothetical protein